MIEIQRLAMEVVYEVLAGASLTPVLQGAWGSHGNLSRQQRGAVQDLSYGVLRFYGQLDTLLDLLLDKPLKDPKLRCLLLVGLYQLEYSHSASHAIVNNAVSAFSGSDGSLRSGSAHGARGLINAVLRNFIRKRGTLLGQVAESEVGRYSHPQWWIDKLRAQYLRDYQAILEASNERAPMTLRVNQRRIGVAQYQALLDQNGMKAQRLRNDALELALAVTVDKLPGFSEGLVSVQDAGAQMAASLLDAENGMRVLDACAAPGGKSAHLLELANVGLTVVDNDAMRLPRIIENFARLGLEADRILHGDASQPSTWWDGELFDRILADVPCSASGVVRRHPDIKWLRRESDMQKFAGRQRDILDALWRILKKGGNLLYVTCSIFAEENGCQVEYFLNHHPDARLLPIPEMDMSGGQLLPDSHRDGFFYALLRKT